MAEQRLVQVSLGSLLVLPQQLKRFPLLGSKLVPLVVKGFLLLRQPPLLRRVDQRADHTGEKHDPRERCGCQGPPVAPCELRNRYAAEGGHACTGSSVR